MTKRLTHVVSLIGVVFMLWFLRRSELGAVAWNCAPYIAASMLALFVHRIEAVFCGALAMLIVDVWVILDSALQLMPSMLLAISILSTIKIFVVFPLGFAMGFAYSKKRNP